MKRRQFLATALGLLAGGGQVLAQSKTYRRIYCPILMYHYVDYPPEDADSVRLDLTVTPEQFSDHLKRLKNIGYTSITLKQLWDALEKGKKLPPKPVILTFDDGYDDAYQYAFPRLKEAGMTGTFFIVGNFMDQPDYLTWEQAAEMKKAGMEIGSHSLTHPDMSKMAASDQLNEANITADKIKEKLGERPEFFCYPLGRYSPATMDIVRQTGHLAALTTADGTLHFNGSLYRLTRVRVRNTTDASSLEWLVNRWI
jgi:peptidoglycan/xylan/chitin deacetylase (PgdA/CDA1 family)